MFTRKTILFLSFPAIFALLCISRVDGIQFYTYMVKPGDTLSEITLIFTGNLNYLKIARYNGIQNPDLIFPGEKITLPCEKPLNTLRNYLRSIYVNKAKTAYKLLSSATRKKFSLSEFKRSLAETTFYDLKSLNVCADFIAQYQHILQIKAFLEDDPASWGFNLVREKYKWHILLFDLNPTFPLDNEEIDWKCK
jgi:hypothetical protein